MEKSLNEFKKENPFIKIDLTETVPLVEIFKENSYIMFEIIPNMCVLHLYGCDCKNEYKIKKVTFLRHEWLNSRTLLYYFITDPDEDIKCVYDTEFNDKTILLYRYTDT